MQSVLDQYLEQLRIESKVRIEKFKRQEEKQTQEAIAHIKLENDRLWSKLVQVTACSRKEKEETTLPLGSNISLLSVPSPQQQSKEIQQQEKQSKPTGTNNHVRFAEEADDNQGSSSPLPSVKRFNFSLDEAAIRNLQHKDLDNKELKLRMEQQYGNHGNIVGKYICET